MGVYELIRSNPEMALKMPALLSKLKRYLDGFSFIKKQTESGLKLAFKDISGNIT